MFSAIALQSQSAACTPNTIKPIAISAKTSIFTILSLLHLEIDTASCVNESSNCTIAHVKGFKVGVPHTQVT